MKVILPSLLILCGYVIGSIPSGAWLANMYGRDITKHGSGNIGATNVGRFFGASGFIIVFMLDFLKSYFYILLLMLLKISMDVVFLCAMSIIIGNSYSVFLKGRGGKGVATSAGVIFALAPPLFLYSLIVWLFFFALTKTVGIASVITYALLPFLTFILKRYSLSFIGLMLFIGAWGIFRHRENIKRFLFKGKQ